LPFSFCREQNKGFLLYNSKILKNNCFLKELGHGANWKMLLSIFGIFMFYFLFLSIYLTNAKIKNYALYTHISSLINSHTLQSCIFTKSSLNINQGHDKTHQKSFLKKSKIDLLEEVEKNLSG